MARDDPQVNLRIPAELKAELEQHAQAGGRSLTAEIVRRLNQSFAWPTFLLGDDQELIDRVKRSPAPKRLKVHEKIMDILERSYPSPKHREVDEDTLDMLYEYLTVVLNDVPDEQRGLAMEELMSIMRRATGNPEWTPLEDRLRDD